MYVSYYCIQIRKAGREGKRGEWKAEKGEKEKEEYKIFANSAQRKLDFNLMATIM